MARFDFSTQDIVDGAVHTDGAESLFELGLMYCAGRDVELDMVEAHKWFNLAALRGNEQAKTYRLELSREMTKKQIAAAQKSAREWLRTH